MSFLNRINEITKPKLHERPFDFGAGDGEETIYIRQLSYAARQRLIVSRFKEKGDRDEDGKPVFELDVRGEGLHVNAELVSECFVTPEGKPIATLEAVLKWDPELVDRIAAVIFEVMNANKKEGDGNPSTESATN